MYIIQLNANYDGSRSPLQTWEKYVIPSGYASCPEEFYDVFYSTVPAGFVNITVENDTVTSMEVNWEALNAYIAENPEPSEPDVVEDANYDDLARAIQEGVNEV